MWIICLLIVRCCGSLSAVLALVLLCTACFSSDSILAEPTVLDFSLDNPTRPPTIRQTPNRTKRPIARPRDSTSHPQTAPSIMANRFAIPNPKNDPRKKAAMSQPRRLSNHAASSPVAHAEREAQEACHPDLADSEESGQSNAVRLLSREMLVPADQETQRMEPLHGDLSRHDEETHDEDGQERVMEGSKRPSQDQLPDNREVDRSQEHDQDLREYVQLEATREPRPGSRPSARSIIIWPIESRLADMANCPAASEGPRPSAKIDRSGGLESFHKCQRIA